MSESAFIERALEPSVANADARFRSFDAEANGERRGDASFHARGSFASERVERAALPRNTMVSGRAPAPSDRSRARAPRLALGARFDGAGGHGAPAAHAGRRRGRAAKVAAVALACVALAWWAGSPDFLGAGDARARRGAHALRVVRASSSNAAAYAALRDRGDVHDAFGDKLRAFEAERRGRGGA